MIGKRNTNYRCAIPLVSCLFDMYVVFLLLLACCCICLLVIITIICLLVITTIVCLLLHLLIVVLFCYYMCVILVGIRVLCSLYKLAHGVDYFQCNEMFAIGKSFVNMNLLLMLMLCSWLKFDGHMVKIFRGLWQASRIGVVFLLFRV